MAARSKQFHYEVLNNARLSPLALMVTMFNALQGTNEYGEEITYKMNGQISVQGFPNVTLQNMFAPTDGGQPAAVMAAYLSATALDASTTMPMPRRISTAYKLTSTSSANAVGRAWKPHVPT